jgi:hypothetical protein
MMVPENLSAYRNDLAVVAAWRETWRKAQDLLLRQETPHIKALIHRIGIAVHRSGRHDGTVQAVPARKFSASLAEKR